MTARMPWTEAERRLQLSADSLVRWTVGRIAEVSRTHGAVPVFVGLDNVVDPPSGEIQVLRDAEAAGLLVFDLFDLWRERDKPALRIAPWDNHPNSAGNDLIAQRLHELMLRHSSEMRLVGPAKIEHLEPEAGLAER